MIGKCFRRCRSEEFRKFLNYDNVPSDLDIHMDNYATHKTEAAGSPNARAGMSTTPRRPPRGQVERFFGLLTEKQLRRGVHQSTADLERATVNDNPKPFRWTGGRNSDSTVLPANAGNRPGSGHKCTNFRIRTLDTLKEPITFHPNSHGNGVPLPKALNLVIEALLDRFVHTAPRAGLRTRRWIR